ncbi:MAG: hypothetical protein ACRDJ4_14290 [Actinomycetota bacterium]
MLIRIGRRATDESGIALIVVVLAMVVVSVLGVSLTISATRDLETSTSVQRASSSLAVAEAGVQHALAEVRENPLPGSNLTAVRSDDSLDATAPKVAGQGFWMDPAAPKNPPADPFQGNVGPSGRYTAYVKVIDEVDVDNKIPPGRYRIVSAGVDRRDSPTRPGLTTVQQDVLIAALDIPFSMFSLSTLSQNGTPTLRSISVYAQDSVFHRSADPPKPVFSPPSPPYPDNYPNECPWPVGCDIFYSGVGGAKLPVAIHTLGTTYKGGLTKVKDQIHPPAETSGCQPPYDPKDQFPFDRDNKGGPYPNPWPCPAALGPAPAYPTTPWIGPKCEDPAQTENVGSCLKELPFDPTLPLPDTYRQLRAIAKRTNTYCKHASPSVLPIADPPPSKTCVDDTGNTVQISDNIQALKAAGQKFFVLYIDSAPTSGPLDVNLTWGTQANPPESAPCDGSMGIIVVRNGNVKWNNAGNWWGAIFVPEGDFKGSGAAGTGWIIGTLKAGKISDAGNIRIQLNRCWKNAIPGFAFSISRLRWHESDR